MFCYIVFTGALASAGRPGYADSGPGRTSHAHDTTSTGRASHTSRRSPAIGNGTIYLYIFSSSSNNNNNSMQKQCLTAYTICYLFAATTATQQLQSACPNAKSDGRTPAISGLFEQCIQRARHTANAATAAARPSQRASPYVSTLLNGPFDRW